MSLHSACGAARLYARSRSMGVSAAAAAVLLPLVVWLEGGQVLLPWRSSPTPLASLIPTILVLVWLPTMVWPLGEAEITARAPLRFLRTLHWGLIAVVAIVAPALLAALLHSAAAPGTLALRHVVASSMALSLTVIGLRFLPSALAWVPAAVYAVIGLWWADSSIVAGWLAGPVTGEVRTTDLRTWLWVLMLTIGTASWWISWRPGTPPP